MIDIDHLTESQLRALNRRIVDRIRLISSMRQQHQMMALAGKFHPVYCAPCQPSTSRQNPYCWTNLHSHISESSHKTVMWHIWVRSDAYTDTGLANSPTVEALSNLAKLATTILQPLRNMLGKPVNVTSGYRSPEVNHRVGGEALSAHLTGRAADIWVAGMTPYQLAKFIQDSGLPYDKVIQEPSWVHVQIAEEGHAPRGQEILARRVNGKMRYTYGLSEVV